MRALETSGSRRVDRGTLSLIAFCSAIAGLLVVHLLRPDYAVRSHMISDYAVGPHGWLMAAVFVAMSAGCLLLALGFLDLGPRVWSARTGSVLLAIVSVGLIASAVFPTDVPGATWTRSGAIHEVSFLVNVGCSVLGALLLSVSFGSDAGWRPFRRRALALAGMVVVGLVLQFLTLRRGAPYGFANRLFVATLLSWFVGASIWLRAQARPAQASGRPR